jgi:segregation and condensation protein B
MESQKLKSQIEAILFLTDKPMKAGAIARIVNQDLQVTRQALLELIHDYEARSGGLEVADDDGYIIQVRSEYAFIIDEFAPMDMSVALLRTLSAIAIKQPVPQSEIVKIRGAGAYDHIKELLERELVIKKEEGGRSPTLSTTKKFQEYFRLTQDAKVLRTELTRERKSEADQAVAEQSSERLAEVAAAIATESIAPERLSAEMPAREIGAAAQAVTDDNHLNFAPENFAPENFAPDDTPSGVLREPQTEMSPSGMVDDVVLDAELDDVLHDGESGNNGGAGVVGGIAVNNTADRALNRTAANLTNDAKLESFEPPLDIPVSDRVQESANLAGDNLS